MTQRIVGIRVTTSFISSAALTVAAAAAANTTATANTAANTIVAKRIRIPIPVS